MEARMIINTRADFDAATEAEQERFLRVLANGVKRWQWTGKKWELETDTSGAEAFGFLAKELPDVPNPEKPDYNPDEQEKQRALEEAISFRQSAYERESDPIYFLWQRGEATEQDWLDAITAIKTRFPKP
jgi:hypothetical protein